MGVDELGISEKDDMMGRRVLRLSKTSALSNLGIPDGKS